MLRRLLEIDGQELAVLGDNEGLSGTPAVFVHGIATNVDVWIPSLPESVRSGRRWYSIGLPGHAPSRLAHGYRAESITEEMFARIHARALEELTWGEPADLVGWSTGGFAALNVAARRPELVRSVMSLCGFATGHWEGTIGLMQRLARMGTLGRGAFRGIFGTLARMRWLYRAVVIQGATNRRAFRQSQAAAETVRLLHEGLKRQDFGVLADLFARVATFDLRPLLPNIRVPTLIVGGDRDPYIPIEQTRLLSEQIPGAELLLLENTGHMFFGESTATYQMILEGWLSTAREAKILPGTQPQSLRNVSAP